MGKDLSEHSRKFLEWNAADWVHALHQRGESLGIGREAIINAFDKAAEELDGGDNG